MKKAFLKVAAAALAVVLIFSGCGSSGNTSPTRGKWNDSTYTSDYAGLTFVMPDGWLAATDEEVASLMGLGAEVFKDSGVKFSETLLKMQTIYDMMAQNKNTGSNVIVMYDNLSFVVGGSKLTEDEYLMSLETQLSQQQAISYIFGDVTEESIGGNNYKVLCAEAPDMGIAQYYCVRKVGTYMIGIIVTVVGDDTKESIFGNFN